MMTQSSPASKALLSVNTISQYYGQTQALNQVSFEINAGFYALLGPNGAGKSTLFQVLTGLFNPEAGSVHIDGINLQKQPTKALAALGIVFQQQALDLDLTVMENLQFYGQLRGMSKKQVAARAHEELARLQLSDVAKQPCRALSGGNRRKIELVRALLAEPRLLLMDEATVGLDAASRDLLLNYVHQLCKTRKIGVLWATHLMDEAESADQILLLNKGTLLQQATPQSLLEQTRCNSLLDAFLHLSGESKVQPAAPNSIGAY